MFLECIKEPRKEILQTFKDSIRKSLITIKEDKLSIQKARELIRLDMRVSFGFHPTGESPPRANELELFGDKLEGFLKTIEPETIDEFYYIWEQILQGVESIK